MNDTITETSPVSEKEYFAPVPEPSRPPREPFTISLREWLCALLMFAAAFLYVRFWNIPEENGPLWLLSVIAAFFILITELIYCDTPRIWESWVWLGCFLMPVISISFQFGSVWEPEKRFLFVHIFFVWWVLSRSGKLLEGKSGHLLPIDAFNAFLAVPFSRFFLRTRTFFRGFSQFLFVRRSEKRRNYWIIPAALLCLLLFYLAASLLSDADSAFGKLFEQLFEAVGKFFRPLEDDFLFYFFFSLPVGWWLFGLISGLNRLPAEKLSGTRDGVRRVLTAVQKLPNSFWTVVIGIFSLLYLIFFILQGSYLFGAFTHTLPEGFIVSQYAREGFFELCKVMAVNFAVLWFATRTVPEEQRSRRLYLAACLALLAESILFVVIALSKLGLYISCFGFTPLRLQSTWLVCTLLAGCVLWIFHLLTGKRVFRIWMFAGAISLSLLTLF